MKINRILVAFLFTMAVCLGIALYAPAPAPAQVGPVLAKVITISANGTTTFIMAGYNICSLALTSPASGPTANISLRAADASGNVGNQFYNVALTANTTIQSGQLQLVNPGNSAGVQPIYALNLITASYVAGTGSITATLQCSNQVPPTTPYPSPFATATAIAVTNTWFIGPNQGQTQCQMQTAGVSGGTVAMTYQDIIASGGSHPGVSLYSLSTGQWTTGGFSTNDNFLFGMNGSSVIAVHSSAASGNYSVVCSVGGPQVPPPLASPQPLPTASAGVAPTSAPAYPQLLAIHGCVYNSSTAIAIASGSTYTALCSARGLMANGICTGAPCTPAIGDTPFSCPVTASLVTCIAAPGAGSIHITAISAMVLDSATGGVTTIRQGTAANCGTGTTTIGYVADSAATVPGNLVMSGYGTGVGSVFILTALDGFCVIGTATISVGQIWGTYTVY